MSLKIILDGKEASLPEDIEVSLNYKNYSLDPEREDSTYPLTLDISPNRHIFGFEERNGNPYVRREYRASVYFGPYCMIEGRAIVTDISDRKIELFISTDKNSFWGDSKKKYIDQLFLGGETYTTPAEMFTEFLDSLYHKKDYIVCPFFKAFSLYPKSFNYLERSDSGYKFMTQYERVQYIPFLRLSSLIRKIFESLGYTITNASILDEEGFLDIIVICTKRTLTADDRFFYYASFLPHLTVSDFLLEIERKFGVVFWITSGSRTVNIFSVSDLGTCNVSVHDNIQKHLIEEDEIGENAKGIIFKDKEIKDDYLTAYQPRLTYTYGDAENAETIECISTITGVRLDTLSEDSQVGNDYPDVYLIQVAAADYPEADTEKHNETINTELRFSVYRGICQPPDGDYPALPYPLASPVGFSHTTSQYSLLWDSLFENYHRQKCETKASFKEEHSFTVQAQIENLKKINTLFENTLIIRNREYICSEQQITLSLKSIKEYTIKCYV